MINFFVIIPFLGLCYFVYKRSIKEDQDRKWYIQKQMKYEIDNKFINGLYMASLTIIFFLGMAGGIYLFAVIFKNISEIMSTVGNAINIISKNFKLPYGLTEKYSLTVILMIIISLGLMYYMNTKKK